MTRDEDELVKLGAKTAKRGFKTERDTANSVLSIKVQGIKPG